MPTEINLEAIPKFHTGQVRAFKARTRYQVLRCGRRWGKTDYAKIIAGDGMTKGQNIGIFVPNYKIQIEVYNELVEALRPMERSSSKAEWVWRGLNGSRLDFWTLENERAGRSRKYHKVIVDEAAFTKDNMMHVWNTAIAPTLLDYRGQAVVMSTPNGIDEENFFYQLCMQPQHGFTEFHAPTADNPFMPAPLPDDTRSTWLARRELEFIKLKQKNHPLVYRQEYLAEFVDWSGVAFFEPEKMLVDGKPVPYPQHIDYVFATIDTAVKDGQEHDGTAVTYWARNVYGIGYPLTILDWDVVQIQGNLLEAWLPTVFQNLEALARQCKARLGSVGAWIEDKMSGTILIQQAQARGWPAQAIESKLTDLGKDARAISVSGYVYRGEVKFSDVAWNKTTMFKGFEKNHLLSQVTNFTIGDKKASTRADDLLDTFTYGVAVALGNNQGF